MTHGDCVDVHLAPDYRLSQSHRVSLYVELLLVIILFWHHVGLFVSHTVVLTFACW